MKNALLFLFALCTSLAAQTAGDYFVYQWDGSKFVKVYTTTFPAATHSHSFSSLTGKPTTVSGYGITDAQPLDGDLTAIADLNTTSFGRSVLETANAASLRTLSGLGTMATQNASAVAITGGTMSGVTIGLQASYQIDPALFDADTIAEGAAGIGWADDKFTIQTPVGAMQFYETGSPAEAVLYWPGRFQVASIEAASITGEVPGNLITSGVIPAVVMNGSMTAPFSGWVNDSSHAGTIGGLTYANTGPLSANEPATPGTYIAAIEVTDGGTENVNALAGRIKTASQLNLAERVSVPSTSSSTGTVGQYAVDASFAYFCTATNTWKRIAISTW